jgi:MFS family permease
VKIPLNGFLFDRVGRRNLIIGAALVAGGATLVVPFLTNFSSFLMVASLLGGALGIFNSISFALASDLSPKDDTGKCMAYSNLASGGANAIAPLIDGVPLFMFGASTLSGFVALFTLSGVFYFMGVVVLFKVPSKAVRADIVLQG